MIHKSWGRTIQLRAIIFGWIFYGDQSSRAPRVLLHVDSPQTVGLCQNEADRHLKVLFDLCKGGSRFRWEVFCCIQIYANLCKTIHDILHGHNFAEYSIITLQYLHYIDHVFCLTPVRSCWSSFSARLCRGVLNTTWLAGERVVLGLRWGSLTIKLGFCFKDTQRLARVVEWRLSRNFSDTLAQFFL